MSWLTGEESISSGVREVTVVHNPKEMYRLRSVQPKIPFAHSYLTGQTVIELASLTYGSHGLVDERDGTYFKIIVNMPNQLDD